MLALLVLSSALANTPPDPPVHAAVKAGIGLPNMLHAHVEVFLSDRWSVEAGGGVGVLPPSAELGARYRLPNGRSGQRGWGLRVGPTTSTFFGEGRGEGLTTMDVDVQLISSFDFVFGARVGLGMAWAFNDGQPFRGELGFTVVPVQVGLAF